MITFCALQALKYVLVIKDHRSYETQLAGPLQAGPTQKYDIGLCVLVLNPNLPDSKPQAAKAMTVKAKSSTTAAKKKAAPKKAADAPK